jgi:predicted phosphodiesterase
MRVGVLGSVHANLPGLRKALQRLDKAGADPIVCLGDVVGYGPFPCAAVDLLRERGVEVIQGNWDRAAGRGRTSPGDSFETVHWERLAERSMEWTAERLTASQRRWLSRLPAELRFRVAGRNLLLTHGLPGRQPVELERDLPAEVYDMLLQRSGCDVMVSGQSNRMGLVRRPRGLLASPGSVGGGTLPAAASAMVVEVEPEGDVSVCWHRVEFDMEEYRREYDRAGLPEVFLRCVELGRDQRGPWHTRDTRRRQQWARR